MELIGSVINVVLFVGLALFAKEWITGIRAEVQQTRALLVETHKLVSAILELQGEGAKAAQLEHQMVLAKIEHAEVLVLKRTTPLFEDE